jgi:iron complex outermembrane recepter protein
MGHEAGRTLILIDGVPVNKSDGGSVNWNAINPGDIEQIEVAKGPGSSLYGGNAMGGVINMITPVPVRPFEANITQGLGSFSTYNTQVGISGKKDDFFWSMNGRYRQSDGYITTPVDEIDEFSIASFLDEYQFGGKAGYQFGANQTIELSGSYYLGQRGTGSKFTGFGFQNEELAVPDGAYNQYEGVYGRATYRGTFNHNSRLNITLFGQRENYQNIRENVRSNLISRYDVESIRQDLGLLSSFYKEIHPNHKLTVGIDIRQGSVDGADVYITSSDLVRNMGTLNQTGLFIQNEMKLGASPWSILAGIRFDHARFYNGMFTINEPTNETDFLTNYSGSLPESSFNALSPRLSIQYYKKNLYRMYAGYSQGFRAPVLDDMCRTGRISGGMKLANPDLKPEYLQNMEVGGDFFFSRILSISPSLFYSRGRDYHAYIATGDSLILNNRMRPIRMKDNIERVNVIGAEIAARLHVTKGLNLGVSYSHINTKITRFEVFDSQMDEELTGKALVYQPKDLFNTSISWRNDILNVFIGFNYKGSQWLNEVNTESIDAYNYTDIHVWKEIFRGFQVSVKAHNVFSQAYVDSRNIIGPRRILMMEATYTL